MSRYCHRFSPLKLETCVGHWCLNGHITYPIWLVLSCLAMSLIMVRILEG